MMLLPRLKKPVCDPKWQGINLHEQFACDRQSPKGFQLFGTEFVSEDSEVLGELVSVL